MVSENVFFSQLSNVKTFVVINQEVMTLFGLVFHDWLMLLEHFMHTGLLIPTNMAGGQLVSDPPVLPHQWIYIYSSFRFRYKSLFISNLSTNNGNAASEMMFKCIWWQKKKKKKAQLMCPQWKNMGNHETVIAIGDEAIKAEPSE